eukprot:gene73-4322_t
MMPQSLYEYEKRIEENTRKEKPSIIDKKKNSKKSTRLSFDNIPDLTFHTCVEYNNFFYIFGGENTNSRALNKLYKINFQLKTFEEIETKGFGPPPISGHSAFVHKNSMYIVGGSKEETSCDLYRFDFEDNGFQPLKLVNDQKYLQRINHTSIVYKDDVYVFGGTSESCLCKFWVNGYASYIEEVKTKKQPIKRFGHSASRVRDKMFITGGFSTHFNNYLNDLWFFDFEKQHWLEIEMKGKIYEPCRFPSIAFDQTRLFLFGGKSKFSSLDNGLFEIDLRNFECKELSLHHDVPANRSGHTIFMHENKLCIFGGNIGVTCKNEIFEISVSSFIQITKDFNDVVIFF